VAVPSCRIASTVSVACRHRPTSAAATVVTAAAALVGLCLQATDTVEAILQDDTATHAVKLRAAAIVLEYAKQYHELDGLEHRVSELERRVLRDGQD